MSASSAESSPSGPPEPPGQSGPPADPRQPSRATVTTDASTATAATAVSTATPEPTPASAPAPEQQRGGRRLLARRLIQLYAGLVLFGASSGLLVVAGLGLEPWGVLHQGLAELCGLSIGTVTIVVGALVLLAWIPIRQRPGLGTVSNVIVVGLAMDGLLAVTPEVDGPAARVALLAAGILLNGVATGLYIAAAFGPGPRDGLMTGLHRRTGRSIRFVRTALEIAVVATGFALGGTVGLGTVAYALAIGPLAQFFLRVFAVGPASAGSPAVAGRKPRRSILRG